MTLEAGEVLELNKTLALSACIEIYRDYEQEEVLRWAPECVQVAWEVGKAHLEDQRRSNRDKLKDFVL